MKKKNKSYNFSANITGTCFGYVTAKSKAEALKKILNQEYDDIMDAEYEPEEPINLEEGEEIE